jgi:hypothetical protein
MVVELTGKPSQPSGSGGFFVSGNGALGRNRTCDLPLRRRLLYPLSYERMVLPEGAN